MTVEKISQCYASTVQRITSRQNALVAEYRAAARGQTHETLLLDGTHLISDAIAADLRVRHALVLSTALDRPDVAPLIHQLLARGVDLAEAPGLVMDAVSPVRSSSPMVALAARPPAPPRSLFVGDSPLVVVICDVQDPGNVGAIIRVAEGAGASGVIVAGQSADPFGWKALRGAMGSSLRLPLLVVDDVDETVGEARRHQVQIVATVPREGRSLFDTSLTESTALFIGGEGLGLTPAMVASADLRVTIPMAAPVESLNAAVAAAVLLYEAHRQRAQAASAP
jgi:TrmH family RNA methyltransferase